MRTTDEALLAGVTADILGAQLERVLVFPIWYGEDRDTAESFWPALALLAFGEYRRELKRLKRMVGRA